MTDTIDLGPGAQVLFVSTKGPWAQEIVLGPSGSEAWKDIRLEVQDPDSKLWRNVEKVEAGQTWRLSMVKAMGKVGRE